MTELPWQAQSDYPILALIQLLPLLAVAIMLLLRRSRLVIAAAVGLAALELGLAINLYANFDQSIKVFQFSEVVAIAGPLNYHAAVDGMAVLFICLAALLTLMIVVYGPVRGLKPFGHFLSVVFAAEATLMGMFATVDLLWFVLLSAAQLVLVAYLLWRWGTSVEQDVALSRFLQFMGTGFMLLLLGTLMLGWNYADVTRGGWTFNVFELIHVKVPAEIQSVVFFLMFYGLGIRIPIFPFHGWLPLAAEHGNISVAPVFLLGVKTGIYGLLRFVFPVMPDAVVQWHPYAVAFAVTGIFYAALLAMLQINLRRMIAYAVVSHTSIVVIGLFSLSHSALQGSVMLSVNFGLATAGMLFMTGFVFRRTGTTLLPQLGGLFDRIPTIGITFLIAALSIAAMPGTPGFDAAHLVLEAAIERFGALVTIAAALGNVAAAGFLLWAFQRAFLGVRKRAGQSDTVERTTWMEFVVAIVVVAVLLSVGFHSHPWLELIDKSLETVSARFNIPQH